MNAERGASRRAENQLPGAKVAAKKTQKGGTRVGNSRRNLVSILSGAARLKETARRDFKQPVAVQARFFYFLMNPFADVGQVAGGYFVKFRQDEKDTFALGVS